MSVLFEHVTAVLMDEERTVLPDAYVAVNGVRSESSLIDLQPGESRWVGVSAGSTDMEITIECDHLVEGQKIEYDADVR